MTRRCWRGTADDTETDGNWKKGERIRARCPGGQGTWVNLGGGGEGGTRTITDGKHSKLNIGTEPRVHIADALGKEIHHPIMSKLWDSETSPTDRQTMHD